MPRTRVVATLGPATASDAQVRELIAAGADVFRLNFSHGSHAEHAARIAAIRRLAGGRPIAILADLAGPKLRLAHPVRGAPGDVVELALPETVAAGDPVLLADGVMQLEVVDPRHARVVVGGEVAAGKGMNLPSTCLDMTALTDKDRRDLAFAVAQGVDVVGLSFVGQARDVVEAQASGLPVIAKIERAQAVAHLEEIVAAADGVMVARGDLGVEIPIARVPIVQKQIIALANRTATPVITATQMLRSMVASPLPTRAEAADVANAVLDGTDAVMLSEETAVGRYPQAAVTMMGRILVEAEAILAPRLTDIGATVAEQVAGAACTIAERLGAGAIVIGTRVGFTARTVARHRPRTPLVALTADAAVRRLLSFVWGVTAVEVAWPLDAATLLQRFREPLAATGLVRPGAPVVIVAVASPGASDATSVLHVATM
jgi:pyruvate kinase